MKEQPGQMALANILVLDSQLGCGQEYLKLNIGERQKSCHYDGEATNSVTCKGKYHPSLPFGEGNGNHSSIPAWRIPWTEVPGRL